RKDVLAQIGVVPDDIRPPDIDESERKGELPRAYNARIVLEKLDAVPSDPDDIVLVADTTVALGRRILGKPQDAKEAGVFLKLLSGRRHRVITGVAVKRGDKTWVREVVSQIKLKVLSDAEIGSYLATEDWRGKAGGYSIQGPSGAFAPWISGSYTAIMGLPVAETANLLVAAGYPLYAQ
ncbi:MAG: nucleoside triphosphate pyrophosphatase, partial [Pseudomonadota bacterium]